MEQKLSINSKIIWNEASVSALIFAGISILYSLLNGLTSNCSPVLAGVLSMLLWVVKFGGIIFLMKFVMTRLYKKYDGVTRKDVRKYGYRIALLSALVYAVFSYLTIHFSDPAAMEQAVNQSLSQMQGMLDNNSMEMMNSMMQNMDIISLISNFIYCYLFGIALSAIIAPSVLSDNPFENQ